MMVYFAQQIMFTLLMPSYFYCCCHKAVVRLTCLRNFLQSKLIATSNLYIKCRTSAKTKLRSHFPGCFSRCRMKMDDIIGF